MPIGINHPSLVAYGKVHVESRVLCTVTSRALQLNHNRFSHMRQNSHMRALHHVISSPVILIVLGVTEVYIGMCIGVCLCVLVCLCYTYGHSMCMHPTMTTERKRGRGKDLHLS